MSDDQQPPLPIEPPPASPSDYAMPDPQEERDADPGLMDIAGEAGGPAPAPEPTERTEPEGITLDELGNEAAAAMDAIGADSGVWTPEEAAAFAAANPATPADPSSLAAVAPGAADSSNPAPAPDGAMFVTLKDGSQVDLNDPEVQNIARLAEILRDLAPLTDEERQRVEAFWERQRGMPDGGAFAHLGYSMWITALNWAHHDKINIQQSLVQAGHKAKQEFEALSKMSARESAAGKAGDRAKAGETRTIMDESGASGGMQDVGATQGPRPGPGASVAQGGGPTPTSTLRPTAAPTMQGDSGTVVPVVNPLAKMMYTAGYSATDSIRKIFQGAVGPWKLQAARSKVGDAVASLQATSALMDEFDDAEADRRAEIIDSLGARLPDMTARLVGAADSAGELTDETERKALLESLSQASEDVRLKAAKLSSQLPPDQQAAFGELAKEAASNILKMIATLVERISARMGFAPRSASKATGQEQAPPAGGEPAFSM